MVCEKVKISSFLKERKDRFKPIEANKLGFKRIEKIDFSGNIHIVEKQTNTGMILVKNGDLVISGINVEKGALAVYEGQEDVLATIHYSSYEYDKNKIDIEYLKWFLKSNVFRNILLEQVGGGIKTELKPKRFLPLEVYLPDLDTQVEIRNKILAVEKEIDEVENRIKQEEIYLKKLKEAILQEAVQGKLVEQNSNDEPASVLLEKIKKEKEQLIKEKKIKKEKPLPKITQDEVPYELPNGWEWVRLDDVTINIHYGFNASADFKNLDVRLLRITDIQNNKVNWNEVPGCKIKESDIKSYELNENDILIARTGGTIGKTYLVKNLSVKSVFASYLIRAIPSINLNPNYMKYFMESPLYWEQLYRHSMGTGQPNVNGTALKSLYYPLPPLEEQKRIVEKVDTLMAYCDELEQEINKSKLQAEQLMQSVLKEAFEQKEVLLVEN